MDEEQAAAEPVYVIESIPVGGDHELTEEEILSEGIPVMDHLRIYRELGRGGMGRVHPATDRNLLRHVALKRLDKEMAEIEMYRDGFIAEAQIAGQLEHPNILPVHELGIGRNGVPYFTMKLVAGLSLDRWLREPERSVGSRKRVEEGVEVFLKVCDAVAYAHHRGVIHRDLKPDNIMVGDFGQVYLMDWGLSRLSKTRPASGARSQMEAKGSVGTPAYMSPEQARGNPMEMDERSDVFGLGAILYEIVSGKVPYGGKYDVDAILESARLGRVTPIGDAASGLGISKRLLAIVDKACKSDAKQRYQSVLELRNDILSFVRGGFHLPNRVVPAGTLILREGDVGDAAYMIISGHCQAVREVNGQKEILSMMGPGDVFGEMALLLDEPRAASVEALDQVSLLVLDKRTMSEGLGIDGWSGALVRALAQRFSDLEKQVRLSGLRSRR